MRSMIIVWLYDKGQTRHFLIEKRKGLEAHPGVAKKK